jgi:hypothetical protein
MRPQFNVPFLQDFGEVIKEIIAGIVRQRTLYFLGRELPGSVEIASNAAELGPERSIKSCRPMLLRKFV